ncbi:MAG TPA: RNA 2',3'-cyclic phosphodiesterase [Lysobacter sp.]
MTTTSQSHRLFFALWPGDALRHSIDQAARRLEHELAPGGRRLDAARYHVTLQFLGDFDPLPPGLVDSACAAAARVRVPTFDMVLDCAGSFRGSNVWWLGALAMPAGLQALWRALGVALEEQGVAVKPSADFHPHLTIQRNVRRHIDAIPIVPLAWAVHEFVLIDSRAGEPYRIVGRWPLPG